MILRILDSHEKRARGGQLVRCSFNVGLHPPRARIAAAANKGTTCARRLPRSGGPRQPRRLLTLLNTRACCMR